MHQISDRVHSVTFPGQSGQFGHNAGVVEFNEYLLAIDACDEAAWDAVDGIRRGTNDKPVRFLALTPGSRPDDCEVQRRDITLLVPGPSVRVEGAAQMEVSSETMTLDDGIVRVVLRAATSHEASRSWTVHVVTSGVLFSGDLVGDGRGSDPLPFDDWISALRHLELLDLDVVIPGKGPQGTEAIVRATRLGLLDARSRITQLIDEGRPREDVIEAVGRSGNGTLPESTVELLHDDHIGTLPATAFIEQLGLREGPSPTADDAGWIPPGKVVVADLWPGKTEQIGLAAPGVEILVARDCEHAAELVTNADAILGWLTPEILANGQRLRWVSLYSAGIESYLSLPGFAESDIVLTNGQRLYAQGGAEHVLGMILSLSRRLHVASYLQLERRWDNRPLTGLTPITGDGSELGELRGKTILVAGLGGIGTEVARLAHGIGMRVLATRASRREGPEFVEYVGLADELKTLAWEADVIVNCLPHTPATDRVFNADVFAVTKPTAFFVNIGRGKTVDTDALVRALRDGHIAGAGLDVTDPEPLPSGHELWSLPNVIITPHVGGDSERHMERIWLLFRENLRRFAVGEPLLSVVNKQRGY